MPSRQKRRHEAHAPSLAAALRVLLDRNSDLVSGHEMHSTLLALLCTNHATHKTLVRWLRQQLATDITRCHEPSAILVHNNQSASVLRLYELLLLVRFRYTTRVLVPVPRERHALPDEQCERLRRENDDVARVVRGRRVEVYAAYSKATGWGIHAAQPIASGEYVGEYTGELITSSEARRRHQVEYDRAGLNYVLALRETTRGDRGGVVRTNVDASRYGSYTRFFNHSCAPTLRVEAVRVDSFVPRLVFFTQRELAIGEQLTFDYGCGEVGFTDQSDTSASTATERDGSRRRVRCQCGAPSCRGWMPFDASL